MTDLSVILLIPIVCIIGAFVLAGLAMHRSTRLKEIAIRERIAMIERGLMPAPEADPARFESALRRPAPSATDRTALDRARRMRDAGVILIGLGAALTIVILGTARNAPLAIGLGGGFAFLGAAFVANALLQIRDASAPRFETAERKADHD